MTAQRVIRLVTATCVGLLGLGIYAMEATASQSKLTVTPQRLESDTLTTLKPVKRNRQWNVVQPALKRMGYDVSHDRVDTINVFTVTVGWDKFHKTFRSYKIDVKNGVIVSIKADYAYPTL